MKRTTKTMKKIKDRPLTVQEKYDYLNRHGKLDILRKHFDLDLEL